MLYVYVFLSTATAWALISVLERMNVSQIAMNSVIAGAFCTLLALLLPLTGISFSMTAPALILLPFLLPLQNRPDIKRRLLNLCLSLGAWSLLDFSGMAFQSCFSPHSCAHLLCAFCHRFRPARMAAAKALSGGNLERRWKRNREAFCSEHIPLDHPCDDRDLGAVIEIPDRHTFKMERGVCACPGVRRFVLGCCLCHLPHHGFALGTSLHPDRSELPQ